MNIMIHCEAKNADDAAAGLQASTADEKSKNASRAGKRRIDPKSLFISRKRRDRQCASGRRAARLTGPGRSRRPAATTAAAATPGWTTC